MSTTLVAPQAQPIVRSCTTAAAIRVQALEPAMELVAISEREAVLLSRINAATHELAQLRELRDAHARAISGFVDLAHKRLQYAEEHGDFEQIPENSEAADSRSLAAKLIPLIDTLAQPKKRRVHEPARVALHELFAVHGEALMEQRVTARINQSRALALKGEYDAWKASA